MSSYRMGNPRKAKGNSAKGQKKKGFHVNRGAYLQHTIENVQEASAVACRSIDVRLVASRQQRAAATGHTRFRSRRDCGAFFWGGDTTYLILELDKLWLKSDFAAVSAFRTGFRAQIENELESRPQSRFGHSLSEELSWAAQTVATRTSARGDARFRPGANKGSWCRTSRSSVHKRRVLWTSCMYTSR